MNIKIRFVLVLLMLSSLCCNSILAEINGLSLEWSNDVVFQTDQYFTNGMYVEYFNNFLAKTFLNRIHFPSSSSYKSFYSIMLQQDIFTPSKQRLPNDRPFASFLILGSKKTSLDYSRQLQIKSEWNVGFLGKYGGGEWVQNGVHALLPTSDIVEGWENQIENDLALNYGLEIEKGLSLHQFFTLSGLVRGKIGSPYTYAAMGLKIRVGQVEDYFSNLGLRSSKDIKIDLFSDVTANVMVYNATIQGGLFNHSEQRKHYTIEPLVLEISTGLNFFFHKFHLQMGWKQISPEIKNGSNHRWGYISLFIPL